MYFLSRTTLLITAVFLSCPFCCAQDAANKKTAPETSAPSLKIVKKIEANEFATNVSGFPSCDDDGNIYILSNYGASSAIGKYSEKGERVALFRADSVTDLKLDFGWNFSVSRDGIVRQIIYVQDSGKRWVATFAKDGTYKSKARLDSPFEINASEVVAFLSGDLLATGVRNSNNPDLKGSAFTGIFSSNGVFLKELTLSDDKSIHDMWASGDKQVVSSPGAPTNTAVERGSLEIGEDGNAYIMRRLSPAIFYVVSPGGALQRRFTVDPGENKRNYVPIRMHASHRRIAILFYEAATRNLLMKIVDLEGNPVATYDDPSVSVGGKPLTLGVSFVCFQGAPERYTFLGVTDQKKLEFVTVEPN